MTAKNAKAIRKTNLPRRSARSLDAGTFVGRKWRAEKRKAQVRFVGIHCAFNSLDKSRFNSNGATQNFASSNLPIHSIARCCLRKNRLAHSSGPASTKVNCTWAFRIRT